MKSNAYKFRAECPADVPVLCEKLSGHITALTQHPIEPGYPDVEVEITTPLSLEHVRTAMAGIQDGHVMAETLATATESQ